MANSDVVLAVLHAYQAQDRDAAERLIGPDYRFTSPQDDHIDRIAYFDRCFPTAARFVSQQVVQLVDLPDDQVLLVYEYTLIDGRTYRNAEIGTVADGQLAETQVYFGGHF